MRWFVTGTEGTPLGLDATTRTWRVCVTITSAGTSNKGEGSQRADVGQRPRRPFREVLVPANAGVIHKNVFAYTTSVAATTFRRVQRLRQPRLSGRPPVLAA